MSGKRSNLLWQFFCHGRIFGILFLISFLLTIIWLIIPVSLKSPLLIRSQKLQYGDEKDVEHESSEEHAEMIYKLEAILDCESRDLTTQVFQRGDYWVLQNLIRGNRSRNMSCAESITFTTVASYNYMRHLEVLVTR